MSGKRIIVFILTKGIEGRFLQHLYLAELTVCETRGTQRWIITVTWSIQIFLFSISHCKYFNRKNILFDIGKLLQRGLSSKEPTKKAGRSYKKSN